MLNMGEIRHQNCLTVPTNWRDISHLSKSLFLLTPFLRLAGNRNLADSVSNAPPHSLLGLNDSLLDPFLALVSFPSLENFEHKLVHLLPALCIQLPSFSLCTLGSFQIGCGQNISLLLVYSLPPEDVSQSSSPLPVLPTLEKVSSILLLVLPVQS